MSTQARIETMNVPDIGTVIFHITDHRGQGEAIIRSTVSIMTDEAGEDLEGEQRKTARAYWQWVQDGMPD